MSLNDQDLSSLIRQHATRHAAPDALRAGVRTQVALAEAVKSDPPRVDSGVELRHGRLAGGWRTAAASFALGLACAMLAAPVLRSVEFGEPVDVELVTEHVRALRLGGLAEVASSDRHTVKPWFQGRLDYAPPVFDLATDGFPLTGGRIEHARGNAVAALVYARNRHVIDVFIWPSVEHVKPVASVRKGFSVLHWADGSMQYWAVSDLERAEMERFVELWRGRASTQ